MNIISTEKIADGRQKKIYWILYGYDERSKEKLIYFTEDAIKNRKQLYSVNTDEEAIAMIINEHEERMGINITPIELRQDTQVTPDTMRSVIEINGKQITIEHFVNEPENFIEIRANRIIDKLKNVDKIKQLLGK